MRTLSNLRRIPAVLVASLGLALLGPSLLLSISCSQPAKDKATTYGPEISNVQVDKVKPLDPKAGNSVYITSGDLAYLLANFAGNGATATLSPGNLSLVSGQPVTLGPLTTNTTYTVTVKDGQGSQVSKTADVLVVDPPNTTITAPAKVITGTIGITASVPNVPYTTYNWSASNATITAGGSAATVTFTPGNAGVAGAASTLTLTCTVTNRAGKTISGNQNVEVDARPPTGLSYPVSSLALYGNVALAGLLPTVAGGDPVQLYTVDKALPPGLVLNAGTGVISGIPTAGAAQAVYTVSATNSGGSASFPLTIQVNAQPTVFLSAGRSTIGLGGGTSLAWSVDASVSSITIDNGIQATPLDTTTLKSGTFNIQPTTTTTYTLTANLVGGGTFTPDPVTVTVDTTPFAIQTFTTDAAPSNVVLFGGNTTLRWTLAGTPVALSLNGASVLGNTSTSVMPVRRQTYALAGNNGPGGVNTDTKTLKLAARGLDLLAGSYAGPGLKDGRGTSALIAGAYGLAYDAAGNLYIADSAASVIRKMDSNGNITTIAGVPGATGTTDSALGTPLFDSPRGIAVTPDGSTIFVSDYNQHTIRKLVKTGSSWTVTTLAGQVGKYGSTDGLGTAAMFDNPWGLALDPDDATCQYLYVADYYVGRVRQVDTTTGAVLNYAGSTYGHADVANTYLGSAKFDDSAALCFGRVGGQKVIFVLDYYINCVRAVTFNGAATVGATTTGGMTGSVYSIAGPASGVTSNTFGYVDATGTAAKFNNPQGMTIDASGNLYIADSSNNVIRKVVVPSLVNGTGVVTTIAGTYSTAAGVNTGVPGSQDSSTGLSASFNGPRALLARGNTLLVSDFLNGTLRAVDLSAGTNGTSTIAGSVRVQGYLNGTGPGAKFYAPTGVATDAAGNAYVADTSNHVIRKVDAAGNVTLLAGNPSVSGNVDTAGGTPSFKSPQGVAVEKASGIVYVADTGNKSIRKIAVDGTVTTVLSAGLSSPYGIVVDPTNVNVLWITDSAGTSGSSANYVRQITLTAGVGAITISVGGAQGAYVDGAVATARFKFGSFAGITADANGNLFVADVANNCIRKLTAASAYAVSTIAGMGTTAAPAPATPFGFIDGALGTNKFYGPQGIDIDTNGNLYVSEYTNDSIRKIDTSGVVTTLVNSGSTSYNPNGSPVTLATTLGALPGGLMQPKSLAVLPNSDPSKVDLLVVNLDSVLQVTAVNGQ